MGRPYQILLPLLSLFLVRVDLTDLVPLKLSVKVLKIYDGDTIFVQHGHYRLKVRFSKIDSPEIAQPFINGLGNAGAYSKQCLEERLKIGSVQELWVEKQDVYGRILGELKGLSFKLIKDGCTTLYPYAQFSSRGEKFRYLAALQRAKSFKKNLWRHGGFRQPKLWRKTKKRSVHQR